MSCLAQLAQRLAFSPTPRSISSLTSSLSLPNVDQPDVVIAEQLALYPELPNLDVQLQHHLQQQHHDYVDHVDHIQVCGHLLRWRALFNVPSSRLTVADCTLTISEVTVLTISWRVPGKVDAQTYTVDLDKWIAIVDGRLVWDGKGGFKGKYTKLEIVDTYYLQATIANKVVKLDLNDHFSYSRISGFEAVPPKPDFEALISSASWMNFRVLANANMTAFLRNPAFGKAVSEVARGATERATIERKKVVDEMHKKMEEEVRKFTESVRTLREETDEKLTTITDESELYIERGLAMLIKSASKAAAAYSASLQLTMMQMQEFSAYESFSSVLQDVHTF